MKLGGNMLPYIYVRGIRVIEHSVFCVENGQKVYWNKQFNCEMAYSSGQQVKRSILDSVLSILQHSISPTTFNYKVEGDSIKPKQAFSICDPSFPDQLLGGWMLAKSKKDKAKKGKVKEVVDEDNDEGNEETEENEKSETIKRRSPLSISAMRPLHPLLADTTTENLSFDRSSNSDIHTVIVRDSKGNIMTPEAIETFVSKHNITQLPTRLWVPDQKGTNRRTSGLFVYDIAIDMRTLFSVSLNQHEPELNPQIIEKLRANGWTESSNVFGRSLVCPREERERIIPALAHGLLNWRITSNQARTFSLMETLAVAISDNANKVAGAIRAKLEEDRDRPKAKPVVDETAGANLFIGLPCDGYVTGVHGTANALEDAERHIIAQLSAFDYENQ